MIKLYYILKEHFDDIRALEMRELQDEEVYINKLKKQREKVRLLFQGVKKKIEI